MSDDGRAAGGPLDYYLLLGADAGVTGILVEEFVRGPDHSAIGLHSAVWTPEASRWRSSASFSRALRTDPVLLARVTPTDRSAAEAAYQRLSSGQLPGAATLRAGFSDYAPFAVAPPLRLGPTQPPQGFREKRVYRVLFAAGQAPPGGEFAGRRRSGDDLFAWQLRRVGQGIGWGLDLTVLLATTVDDTVGPVLHELTSVVRRQGLIPVTTERFA
jgi:hypothetical protein